MYVSVLIPSRGRPHKLCTTIASLLKTASIPSDVEILVRADLDDELLLSYVSKFARFDNVHFLVGRRGNGYLDANIFWNELARFATGRWLVCFNDDAIMESPGWDAELERHETDSGLCLVHPYDNYNRTSFPIVTRAVYETLGHIAVFPGVDTWMNRVAAGVIPTQRAEAIRIRHERPNLPGYAHLNDKTWEESDVAEQQLCREWNDKARWDPLAEKDIAKLKEAMSEC